MENVYEIGVHIIPSVKEKDADKFVEAISSEIKKLGGEILEQAREEKGSLAYTISYGRDAPYEKMKESYFASLKFTLNPENVSKVDEFLSSSQSVLRFIVFKSTKENTRAPESAVKELQERERENNQKNRRQRTQQPETKEESQNEVKDGTEETELTKTKEVGEKV